jgi:hypothetical protein
MMQRSDDQVYQNTDSDYTPRLIDVGVYCFPEYSRGVLERGKNCNISFKNIKLSDSKDRMISIKIVGFDDEHKSSDVVFDNLQLNSRKITDKNEINLVVNEFCERIEIKNS